MRLKMINTFSQHKSNNASTLKIWPDDNPTGRWLINGDFDDEDLANVDDDDGVEVMSADVARGHDGDGGGDDRKITRKPNLGGRKADRLHTCQETRNLGLKKIINDKGPILIRFEWDDKKTMMPLGDHASHCSNYLGELIKEMPLYYPSWQKFPAERKAAIVTKIGDEMLRLKHLGSNTETGMPYTEEEIMTIVRKGKQRGHLPGVGRVLSGCATDGCPPPPQSTVDLADVEKLKKNADQFESSPEFGGASGSGGCGDDEPGSDEDGDEDKEDGDS
ncbi:hypothetical protein Tco_1142371 [Tanacetum coccineum]